MELPVRGRGLAPITNRMPVVIRFLPNIKYFSRDNGMRRIRRGYSSRAVRSRGAAEGGGERRGGACRVTRFECI